MRWTKFPTQNPTLVRLDGLTCADCCQFAVDMRDFPNKRDQEVFEENGFIQRTNQVEDFIGGIKGMCTGVASPGPFVETHSQQPACHNLKSTRGEAD